MANPTTDSIAAEVRAEIGRVKWRTGDVARTLGLTVSAASRKVSGKVPFTVVELVAIANALDIDVARFFATADTASVVGATSGYTDRVA